MTPQPSSEVSLQKISLITFLTAVFFGISLWMVIPAPPTGFSWDDAWYQLLAEWLSADSDYRLFAWAMLRVTSYPPIFPLLMSWSGASLTEPQNAFIMNAVFLASGAGVAMYWFAREGFSAVTMTFAGILVAFNPVSLGYLPILYSEFLFILLTTIAFMLAVQGREWKWNSKWAVIGIIVGLSVATRTAGWPLVAGFLLHLILSRRLQPVVAFSLGLGAGLIVIPFFMVGLPATSGYTDQLLENMDNLGWDFLVRQFQGLVLGWSMLWGWGVGAWLALVAVIPGFLVRLKANRADAWYVVMYLGMLLVWPWPGHMGRFVWPLLPCFLVAAHSSFTLLGNPKYRSVLASVSLGLILVMSIPDGIGRSFERLLNPPEGELFQLSRMHEWTRSSSPDEGITKLTDRQHLLSDLQRINEIIETKSCVLSEMSALLAVQSQRLSYPVPWLSLDEAGQTKIVCQYYYMVPDSIAGITIDEINRFAAMHDEIFRSSMPGGGEGELPMGVFIRFRLNSEE